MENCIYCTKIEQRKKISRYVCDLNVSSVFLLYDQTFPGRCVVAFKDHKTELFALTKSERDAFAEDVSIVANAISELYHADKVEYAIFGDKMPHLHVHLAVKRKTDPDFGTPYNQTTREKVIFTDEQMNERISEIMTRIKKL